MSTRIPEEISWEFGVFGVSTKWLGKPEGSPLLPYKGIPLSMNKLPLGHFQNWSLYHTIGHSPQPWIVVMLHVPRFFPESTAKGS